MDADEQSKAESVDASDKLAREMEDVERTEYGFCQETGEIHQIVFPAGWVSGKLSRKAI